MLSLFPSGLDGTLLVPVMVGLLVMTLTTEWWGWDFVGIVVPGYLSSVLMLQPVVAGVVLLEAAVTWALVVGLDRTLTALRLTFPVFGRDRFYLMLVASVAVRVVLEGFVLQAGAELLAGPFPQLAAHRTELFGIGVVLVPLTANRLWRPGLATGLWQLAAQTGVVFLAVAGLSKVTNFSIGGFELAYDQLALAFLSSPRAQIALVVTAALASGFNRRYGWDFHGILVPALLALAVLTPIKLVSTLAESALIVVTAKGILKLPAFRKANVEGSRKLLLCFLVGFGYKLALASLLASRYPGFRPTDFFGLGYVLPSLLAERIWLKQNLALVFAPTVQTSLLGAAAAAALVVALGWLAPAPAPVEAAAAERFASLPQAVAALGPGLRRAPPGNPLRLAERARRGEASLETADGYRVLVAEGTAALVAFRPESGDVLVADLESSLAEAAAGEAVRRGCSLLLEDGAGALEVAQKLGTPSAFSPVASAASKELPVSESPARALLLERPPPASPPVPAPARALAEAGWRLDGARGAAVPVDGLAALGMAMVASADGQRVATGAGFPSVALREGAGAVVVAAHPQEVGAAEAAAFAAEVLGADLVVSTVAGGEAVVLARALAQVRLRPLLIVRGAAALPEGDALLHQQPEPVGAGWLGPLETALAGQIRLAADPSKSPELRAFPPASGRSGPVALLWLTPRGRRLLSGQAQELDRPELLALAAQRGVGSARVDLARWLAQGKGAPSAGALEQLERLARTRDVAQLRQGGRGELVLLFDGVRGLAGVGVQEGGRRALAIAGPRREERVSVSDQAQAAVALAGGARTLVSAATR